MHSSTITQTSFARVVPLAYIAKRGLPVQSGESDIDQAESDHSLPYQPSPDHSPDFSTESPTSEQIFGFILGTFYEFYVRSQLKDIYLEATGKTISKLSHALLTELNYQCVSRSVQNLLESIPESEIPCGILPVYKQVLEKWLLDRFGNLHTSRMYITMLMTGCGLHGREVVTVEQMDSFLESTFSGLV